MRFDDLNLIDPLLRAVRTEGYEIPTPIQEQAIPHILAGRDVLGCAQTGTGKTAAFALPILQRLSSARPGGRARPPRVLVLTPTRELATQIGDSFATYGRHTGLTHTVVFGGVGQSPQVAALRRGVDILVATPGRLLDLMGQGVVTLTALDVFVLDEADRMLDMGFLPDVRRIIKALPSQRQTLFFSATMPRDIEELAQSILTNPVGVAVTPVASTAERIEQSVYFVEKADKRALLAHLLREPGMKRALVFTRTKHGANRVVKELEKAGIGAEAIHGNKSQGARERALENFKRGTTRVLVATDIAARGIDVEGISHVINYDLPNIAESYVHRIGRTARAGAGGIAISFCDHEERAFLRDIERLIRQPVPVVQEHPYRSTVPFSAPQRSSAPSRAPQRRSNGNGSTSNRSNGNGSTPNRATPAAAPVESSEGAAKRRSRRRPRSQSSNS
ncbi:MAG TPA: DEAD/DEAH box helicase [Ardenticatenaceae bacterium]|jgi:ATP-dependent RNA helicase RhlE